MGWRSRLAVAGTLLGAWASFLLVAPLIAGWIAGAAPIRLVTGGILFDLTSVSLAGYRTLMLAPSVVALAAGCAALYFRPSRTLVALGVLGFTFAGTELVIGGGLGIGPAGQMLIGTEWRWLWRICVIAVGLMIALAGAIFVRTNGEDHEIAFAPIRRDLLMTGAVVGLLILLVSPGPILGKVMTGVGSWLGSLVWVLGL